MQRARNVNFAVLRAEPNLRKDFVRIRIRSGGLAQRHRVHVFIPSDNLHAAIVLAGRAQRRRFRLGDHTLLGLHDSAPPVELDFQIIATGSGFVAANRNIPRMAVARRSAQRQQ